MKFILGVFVLLVAVILFVPNNVVAEEIPEEFQEILNKDGYLKVDSIPPTTQDQAFLLIGDYVLSVRTDSRFNLAWDSNTNSINCSADYTVCDIEHYESGKVYPVKIKYSYDKEIKKIVDEYVEKLGNKSIFSVRDMEIINFWVNAKGDESLVKDYSSELKQYFDFKNFEFDIRLGNPGEFIRLTGGEGNIVYDGTIYHFGGYTEVQAKHVLYVPETTGDSKEELMVEIQKRINNYIGKNVIEITYGGNVYDYHINNFDKDIADAQRELDLELAKPTNEQDVFKIMDLNSSLQNYNYYKNYFLESWNNNTGEYAFLKDAAGGHFFYATIPGNEGSENVFKFIIVKDDDKMYTPSHITTDVTTNVTISSNDSSIPLDTLIRAKELTNGKEYEKIMKILNVASSLTFDLNLYSNSLENYITKLADGSFEVKIPIPDKFKGKDLIVYYVKDDGKVQNYDVTLKGDYAVFNTNHFSIYTLALKESDAAKPETIVKPNVPTKNPDTSDNIIAYFGIGIVSVMGLLVVNKKFRRES